MIIIGNGKVITRNIENPLIENGAVAIENTLIKEVGFTENIKSKYPNAEYIDVKGKVIMPGFINTHEHIYSALARGLSINNYNPNGFLDILDGMWWNIDRHLTNESTRQSAIGTYIDCIKNGVTTVFDHHASYGQIKDSLFTIGDVAKDLGIRTCLCYEVSDRDGENKMRQSVLENEAFIKYALNDNTDMIAGMMGLHASFTLSDNTLDYCEAHKDSRVGYHIHVAEGIEDLYDSLKKYNKRIVDRLMDKNILGPLTIAAHCIYINKHEMDLLKETDTIVVHNPESNMGNACGCPPTLEILHNGIMTGLGTDGYTHDMIESYKVANILHKHNLCDATVAWTEIPQMLFENNAKIANRYFKTPLGILKESAAADIIVVDYDPITPMYENNINSHILFGMNGRNVVSTIINGKILMKDRELLYIDEEKAMAETRKAAVNLWKSINS